MVFYIISDPHYFSKKYFDLSSDGKPGEVFDQLQRYESREMLLSALETVKRNNDADFVVITGDVTNNAEPESHKEVLEILHDFKRSGIKLYVLTASHDFAVDESELTYSYTVNGERRYDLPRVGRDYIKENYFLLGPEDAVAYDESSMSYVIQLKDNTRLFIINDDGYLENGEYQPPMSDREMLWLERQASATRADGQKIIACTHRPLLPNTPINRLVYANDLTMDFEKQDRLADMGLRILFTGHTHMQNIDCTLSRRGNVLYEVNTGSTCGFPPVMRRAEYDAGKDIVKIDTITLDAPASLDLDGKTFKEYARSRFSSYFKNIFDAFNGDADMLAAQSKEIHINPELVRKNSFWIMPLGRRVLSLTFGKVGRLLKKESGLSKEELEKLNDRKISDFIIDIIMKIFEGNADISPSSPEYKLAMSLMAVIDDFLSVFHVDVKKLIKEESVSDFVAPLLVNSRINDSSAVLHLGEVPYMPPAAPKYKSKKGRHTVFAASAAAGLATVVICGRGFKKIKANKSAQ